VATVWCAGILIAPLWAESTGISGNISFFLYKFYSNACHQLDDRSFHLMGHEFGVCSRCTTIYFGFLLSSIIYPFVKKLNHNDLPSIWILIAGAGLVGLDGGLDWIGVWQNTFLSREITGSILGLILPFYIIPGFIKVFDDFIASRVVPAHGINSEGGADASGK